MFPFLLRPAGMFWVLSWTGNLVWLIKREMKTAGTVNGSAPCSDLHHDSHEHLQWDYFGMLSLCGCGWLFKVL